jgi:hypothetical protein
MAWSPDTKPFFRTFVVVSLVRSTRLPGERHPLRTRFRYARPRKFGNHRGAVISRALTAIPFAVNTRVVPRRWSRKWIRFRSGEGHALRGVGGRGSGKSVAGENRDRQIIRRRVHHYTLRRRRPPRPLSVHTVLLLSLRVLLLPQRVSIIYIPPEYSSCVRACTRCRTTPTECALPLPLNWVSIYYIVPSTLRSHHLVAASLRFSPSLPPPKKKHNITILSLLLLLLSLILHDERNNRKVALVYNIFYVSYARRREC